jgi:uncharacterized membrane protein YecN with MAPEG domain
MVPDFHLYVSGDLDPATKLTFTLKWQILNVAALVIGIIAVGEGRRTNPASFDPLTAQDNKAMQINQRYLQNTLEQFVLVTIVQLCLATWLESHNLKVIPLLCIHFLIGRISFLVGYHIGPEFRAFGFATTWIQTLFTFLYCLYRLCTQ